MSKEQEDRIFVDFNPNDFVLRISPVLDDNDVWTGELHVGYLTMDENYLSEDDYKHLDMVANLTLSAIPLMEEDMEFRNKLYKYTMRMLKEEDKPKYAVVEDDSNVIQLRFGTEKQ